jgi:hypothetical protein
MAAEPPTGYIVHSTTGRVRFRFPAQRGDAEFFDSVAMGLARHSSVLEARASAQTGSVLVLHTGDLASLVAYAQKRGLFEAAAPPGPPTSFRRIRDAFETLDDRVAKGTGDTLSVSKLMFFGLLGAGIFQANRGHLFPAGMTLFKHALEIMDWVADREPSNSQHRP